MKKYRYNVGDIIGRLTVIEILEVDHANKRLVLCKCECGSTVTTRMNNLGRKTNSCGCLRADLIKARMGLPIKHLASTHVWGSCKRHTKNTDLTKDDVQELIFSKCFYCEMGPENVGTTYVRAISDGRFIKRVGIDRIDSSRGYYKDNVVACCKTCNILKRDYSVEYLISKLTVMLKNLKNVDSIISYKKENLNYKPNVEFLDFSTIWDEE